MPIAKKFSDAQIYRLYQEYTQQDKPLLAFLEEKGLEKHYHAIRRRFEAIEKRLAKGLPPILPKASKKASEDVAEDEVASTLQKEIADEARRRTEGYLILAKGLWKDVIPAIAEWKKIPPHQLISENPLPHIMEAINKARRYEALQEEVQRLQQENEFLKRRADPYLRMECALDAYISFLAQAVAAKALGVDITKTRAKDVFAQLIDSFLTGKPLD